MKKIEKKIFLTVKEKIKENKNVYFWAKLLQNFRKEDFRDCVRKFGGSDIMYLEHPGKLYPDYLVYQINGDGNKATGFFAQMRDLLEHLSYAERYQLIPVVNWEKDWVYREEVPVNGTVNVFEYYFEPVSDITIKNIGKCKNVVVFQSGQKCISLDWGKEAYREMEQFLPQYASLYRKYCRLNKITQEYIDDNIKRILKGKRTLGIHIRGTDFKKAFNHHPIYVKPEDFVEPVKKLVNKYQYEQIFLATDSKKTVGLFKEVFMDALVVYTDTMRSDGDTGLHVLRNKRKNNGYMLGLEVLRDVCTLASCDSLVAGMSHVSLAAQYIKLAAKISYEEVLILDHGINHNNNSLEK